MVIGTYQRTFENSKGVVHVVVTNSDVQGASVSVLIRYGDSRADDQYGRSGLADFNQAIQLADSYFQNEVQKL
jgi:hypothetical protein